MGEWEIKDVEQFEIKLEKKDLPNLENSNIEVSGILLNLTRQHTNSFIELNYSEGHDKKSLTIKINNADETLNWGDEAWNRNTQNEKLPDAVTKELNSTLNQTIKTINYFEN